MIRKRLVGTDDHWSVSLSSTGGVWWFSYTATGLRVHVDEPDGSCVYAIHLPPPDSDELMKALRRQRDGVVDLDAV